MSKKLGLALGSGGARGAAHIAFLRALEEEGIEPYCISGCSMGAVVGAGYAAGMTTEELKEKVADLSAFDLIDPSVAPLTKLGLLKGNKMRKLLLSNLGEMTFDELKKPFACVATDIYSGRSVELKEGSVVEAVRASSAIPTVFRPVERGNMLLVDGGVLCRVPVKLCKSLGADVVVAFDVLANTGESVEKVSNLVQKILRIFDIMDYNQNENAKILMKDYYDLWLSPEMEGLSQYNVKDVDKAYELGYEFAKQHVGEIKDLLG